MKMSFQLQMGQMPGYLVAKFIGMAVPGEGSQQYELIAERCKLTNMGSCLRGRGQVFNWRAFLRRGAPVH